jgi:hypothetical protein
MKLILRLQMRGVCGGGVGDVDSIIGNKKRTYSRAS